ncbi:hypothetical protein L218DRAFT_957365 [Marasmius fiardii PR-910]|nr:hypothetical protein L218DRAFT_957365 [Marasmius fiardii PR-910]
MTESLESLLSERRHLCCVVVGSLAVVLWDILLHIKTDITLIRKTGLHLPQVIYVISRFATMGFLLCETVLLTVPVGKYCNILMKAVTSLGSMHYTSIGLLNLLRTRAIYLDQPWVVRFFFLFWFISSGTSIGIGPFILHGGSIVDDKCMYTNLDVVLLQISIILNTLQGTCIFLATSSGLILSPPDTEGGRQSGLFDRLKLSLSAKDVPFFSKSLLRHSQWYFLWLLGLNLSTIVGIGLSLIPLAYRIGWLVIWHVVLHCRACSVFRNVGAVMYTLQNEQVHIQDLPISFSRNPDPSLLSH